jgi:hypothetical protein
LITGPHICDIVCNGFVLCPGSPAADDSDSGCSSSSASGTGDSHGSHTGSHSGCDNDSSDSDGSSAICGEGDGDGDDDDHMAFAEGDDMPGSPPVHDDRERFGRFLETTDIWNNTKWTEVSQGGVHRGWEVSCKIPSHNVKGQLKCCRTLRFIVGDPESFDLTLRRLRWWVTQGHVLGSRRLHMDAPKHLAGEDLPSLVELAQWAQPAGSGAASSSGSHGSAAAASSNTAAGPPLAARGRVAKRKNCDS